MAMIITVASSKAAFGWSYYVPVEEVIVQDDLIGTETYEAGTVISYLPDGAKSVIIDRTQYFVSGGNWFLPIVGEEIQYLVVLAPV